jgi:hypothetical protein
MDALLGVRSFTKAVRVRADRLWSDPAIAKSLRNTDVYINVSAEHVAFNSRLKLCVHFSSPHVCYPISSLIFIFPVRAITASGVSMNRFSTLCGWLAQRQGCEYDRVSKRDRLGLTPCLIIRWATGNENFSIRPRGTSSFPFPFVPLQHRGCLVAPLFLWIV